MSKAPRGIRNHNPGNIEHNGTPWQGLDTPPSDGRFCRFVAPVWGIRALARTLISYQDKHGLNTVRGIINRWAPPVENNTNAYVHAVADRVGVAPDWPIDVHDYAHAEPLVKAIIHHENGQQPYDQATIDEGLKMAGVRPPLKPLTKSKELAAAGAAGAGGLATTADAVGSMVGEIVQAQGHISTGTWVGLATGLALLGLGGFLAWNRLRARKAGVR